MAPSPSAPLLNSHGRISPGTHLGKVRSSREQTASLGRAAGPWGCAMAPPSKDSK